MIAVLLPPTPPPSPSPPPLPYFPLPSISDNRPPFCLHFAPIYILDFVSSIGFFGFFGFFGIFFPMSHPQALNDRTTLGVTAAVRGTRKKMSDLWRAYARASCVYIATDMQKKVVSFGKSEIVILFFGMYMLKMITY